jgi:hypothetical protein
MIMGLSRIKYLIILFVFITRYGLGEVNRNIVQFISPLPDAKYVSKQTSIIIRYQSLIPDYITNLTSFIHVDGTKSGPQSGKTIISDDDRTIIFRPESEFLPDDTITVYLRPQSEIKRDMQSYSFSYKFYTSLNFDFLPEEMIRSEHLDEESCVFLKKDFKTTGEPTIINGVAVPSDFPVFEPSIFKNNIASGRLFLNNWRGPPYILILENDGTPYFYRRVEERSRDFKVQPTGVLSRRVRGELFAFVSMDKNYVTQDTFACQNGLYTDEHELQILSNGHALLIGYDFQKVDMSLVVPGGKTGANVIGNYVQELDLDKNVVFEWRSWDHFEITDLIGFDLTAQTIDYVHMNSIAVDYDCHLVISSRHLSECTKINRQTGEIIWRLGGKKNQFDFINDPDQFSYQHDIQPVPDKPDCYTLFDNGNFHDPKYSRAVEYRLDTIKMIAEKIWEYRHSPDRYANQMANVQRLPNGNTLINWALEGLPKATEVTSDGEIVYEADFLKPSHCYRTFRFEWEGMVKVPYLIAESYPDKVVLIFNKFGDDTVNKYRIYGGKSNPPTEMITSTKDTWIHLTELENSTTYYFSVTAVNSVGIESGFSNIDSVFVRFYEPNKNMVLNHDFSDSLKYWEFELNGSAVAQSLIDENGAFHFKIDQPGKYEYMIQLRQHYFPVFIGEKYLLEFDAYADADRTLDVRVELAESPWDNYGKIGLTVLKTFEQHYAYEFVMNNPSDLQAQIVFNAGQYSADIYLDNVSFKQVVESSVEIEHNSILKEFRLYQNYPNPYNATTSINYDLPIASHVLIKIFNIRGEEIITLVDRFESSGRKLVFWDGFNAQDKMVSSGIYVYRIETGSFSKSRKMIFMK